MYRLFDIANKVVVVTGTTGGIGGAIARGLIEHNAQIIGIDRRDPTITHPNFTHLHCDISDTEEIISVCRDITVPFSGLVNCAAITSEGYDLDNWENTISTNLRSIFLICRELIPKMITPASIINFTSMNSDLAFSDNPAYMASKGGVRQLTRALAKDFAPGIRVNAIAPGYVRTRMTEKSWNDLDKRAERSTRMMLQRWADPEDFIGPAIFLLSDASRYITGQNIFVDGGWSINAI